MNHNGQPHTEKQPNYRLRRTAAVAAVIAVAAAAGEVINLATSSGQKPNIVNLELVQAAKPGDTLWSVAENLEKQNSVLGEYQVSVPQLVQDMHTERNPETGAGVPSDEVLQIGEWVVADVPINLNQQPRHQS